MYRGTTPTLVFKLPFNNDGIEKVYITFNQLDNTIIEKTEEDIVWDEQQILLTLSQADTLNLTPGIVKIQLRIRYTDGTALASNTIITTTHEILKDGVI